MRGGEDLLARFVRAEVSRGRVLHHHHNTEQEIQEFGSLLEAVVNITVNSDIIQSVFHSFLE
jgi:hypothetical protein